MARSLVFALVGTLVALAAAQAADATEVVWVASATNQDLPDQVVPGYTIFTVDADGDTEDGLSLFRLHEGTTVDDLAAAMARIDEAFGGAGDPVEAINAALQIADAVGEVVAQQGGRRSFGVILEPGRYAVEYTPQSDGEGAPPPTRTYHELVAEGEPGADAPEADVTVHMVDFAFAFPPDLAAGEQTWRVVNSGQQIHHIVMFRLGEGVTMPDFMAWMESQEGPPPGEQGPYVGVMSTGEETFHQLELEEGTYVAICFMPDHLGDATGAPHFTLGMIQEFQVGAAD